MGKARNIADSNLTNLAVDSNTLVVDSANDRVGVGTSSPAVKLQVAGSIALTSANNLSWGGAYGAGIPTLTADGTNGFQFYPAGSTSGETMRINASGNVGIGVSNPTVKLVTYANLAAGTSNTIRLYSDAAAATSTSNNSYGFGFLNSTGILSYTAGTGGNHVFYTANTERMRIDSSGNVGIGVSNPSGYSSKLVVLASAGGTTGIFTDNTNYTFAIKSGGSGVSLIGGEAGNNLAFQAGAAERMRLDTSGNLLVGTTSAITGSNTLHIVNSPGDSTQIRVRNSGAASGRHWRYGTDTSNTIYIINQDSAGVYMGNGSTSWSGLSDERSKDIIEPITDAVEKISTLRTVIGKYKTDDEGTRRSFLIAQDVQAVLPEAVSVANQETGYLGLSYTDTIPLLVAAIKEQQAIITDLKSRIEALENK
jgi:hypothetical protein